MVTKVFRILFKTELWSCTGVDQTQMHHNLLNPPPLERLLTLAVLGHSAELRHLLSSYAHRAHTHLKSENIQMKKFIIPFWVFWHSCCIISHLSICHLWRLENAFLHKTFLAKCLFTEVLPLPLLPLTLKEEKMSVGQLNLFGQPPSQSLPTLPSSSPSWLSGIHFGRPPVPSCSL